MTIITRDDLEEIEWLKKHLIAKFKIKDIKELEYFLSIELTH